MSATFHVLERQKACDKMSICPFTGHTAGESLLVDTCVWTSTFGDIF